MCPVIEGSTPPGTDGGIIRWDQFLPGTDGWQPLWDQSTTTNSTYPLPQNYATSTTAKVIQSVSSPLGTSKQLQKITSRLHPSTFLPFSSLSKSVYQLVAVFSKHARYDS